MKLRENIKEFQNVLESAYSDYYDQGLMPDMAAITLDALTGLIHTEYHTITEMIENQYEIASIEELNESAPPVGEPKIVKERKGKGVSITIGSKEYRYVSPEIPTDELFKSVYGMWKHGGGFKVVNYLKKHAVCYFGARKLDPSGLALVGA